MNKLEHIILYILRRAKEKNKTNLSKIELHKLIYLLEVESFKFTGEGFFDESIGFVREENGPISLGVYRALDNLMDDYIKINEIKKPDYPFARHCISLVKEPKKYNIDDSEILFINSVLDSYLPLNIKALKSEVYATEPMIEVQNEERKQKVKFLKGKRLNFESVTLDEDLVDVVAS